MQDELVPKDPAGRFMSIEQWAAANPMRQWRRMNNMSQSTLRIALGCSPGSIPNWESGAIRRPSAKYFTKLANLMQVPKQRLLEAWVHWDGLRPACLAALPAELDAEDE